jgi:hypothetical protein
MGRCTKFRFALTFLSISLNHCSTTETVPDTPTVLEIDNQTVLPKAFTSNELLRSDTILRVQRGMLQVSKVARATAELREGPGAEFKIKDQLLTKGDVTILFQRVGVWQKIFATKPNLEGWIHTAALAPASANRTQLEISQKHLPTVISVRSIDTAFDYKTRSPLKIDLPKGIQFVTFGWEKGRVLVYLPESNSVMWLRKDDAN